MSSDEGGGEGRGGLGTILQREREQITSIFRFSTSWPYIINNYRHIYAEKVFNEHDKVFPNKLSTFHEGPSEDIVLSQIMLQLLCTVLSTCKIEKGYT